MTMAKDDWEDITFLNVLIQSHNLYYFLSFRYTKMKTATNIYIFNLAMADALVTTTMPFQSTEYLMNSWPFGDVLCKIVISIDYYNMFTSIFTLTMMSVDRYIAVCHPVKALDFRTPLKAKIINICIWLLSSSVGISAIVLGGTKVREGECEHSERTEFSCLSNDIKCSLEYRLNLLCSYFSNLCTLYTQKITLVQKVCLNFWHFEIYCGTLLYDI